MRASLVYVLAIMIGGLLGVVSFVVLIKYFPNVVAWIQTMS